jgi:hypothetical protein
MTLFFNLSNLEKEARSDNERFITLLRNFYYKKPPKNIRLIPKSNLHGPSFLLNPEPLLDGSKVPIEYIVQYIKLAARRDYFLYKQFGVKTLDLSFFPDLNYTVIRYNPILKIKNNQIHFYYEEKKEYKWH